MNSFNVCLIAMAVNRIMILKLHSQKLQIVEISNQRALQRQQ
jgi:hypothetical protein